MASWNARPNARRLAACLALALGCTHAAPAQGGPAAGMLIGDAKSQPESLTMAPGGVLLVGSASTPFIYKVRAGSAVAEKFIDAGGEGPGTFFFGMLADPATNTLWTCQLTPVPGTQPVRLRTALRGFDLLTGAPRLRWNLPGNHTMCNDFALGPDRALYLTDTANGRIYKLPAGASAAELYLENHWLVGIDGITFLNGTLYVDNVYANKLYRIPVDAAGKPGSPVRVWMFHLLHRPDGLRAAQGKLFLAENGSGTISALTLSGDWASVTTVKEGLTTPTGVEPAGATLWISERATGKVWSVPMPK